MEWLIVVVVLVGAGWILWKAARWYNATVNPPAKPAPHVKIIADTVTVRATLERPAGPPPGYVSPYLPSERWDELLVLDDGGMPPLRLSPFKDALWLQEKSTGQFVNAGNRKLAALGIWAIKVRGVAYYEDGMAAADPKPGEPVTLQREPNNQFDKNAIAVVSHGQRIGYINKGMAARMAKRMDAGEDLAAIVMQTGPLKIVAGVPELLSYLTAPEAS